MTLTPVHCEFYHNHLSFVETIFIVKLAIAANT